jgi:hypothetical protein
MLCALSENQIICTILKAQELRHYCSTYSITRTTLKRQGGLLRTREKSLF